MRRFSFLVFIYFVKLLLQNKITQEMLQYTYFTRRQTNNQSTAGIIILAPVKGLTAALWISRKVEEKSL